MHLGRFHYVAWLVRNYFENTEIIRIFDETINQLQAYISAPNEDNSKIFRTKIDQLLSACAQLPPGYNTASFKQIIAESSGENYFGIGLERSLREIFEKQSMTPAEMLVNLQKFRKKLGNYLASIIKISDELVELEVEYEDLYPDQFEFGALFPKELIGSSISDIEGELEHLNRLFKALNEIMGKGSTSPKVRSISSSWWQFFIDLDYQQIAAITLAIERIVALYKNNLEIQKLKQDMEKNELGQDIIDMINIKIEEKLKNGMLGIAEEIRKEFQNNQDKERCNELEIQLRMELVHFAKRINQGAAYEIRAGLPDLPKALTDAEKNDPQAVLKHETATKEYEEQSMIASEINSAGLRVASAIEDLSGGAQLLTDYAKLTESIQNPAPQKNDKEKG